MIRYLLIILQLIVCLAAVAQNGSQVQLDSTIEKSVAHDVYLGAFYQLNQFAGTGASFAGIQAGIVIDNKVDVSVYYSGILDDFKLTLIFPEQFGYHQQNYGVLTNYNFLNGSIQPILGAGYQYSVASWLPEMDSNDEFSDNIHMFTVTVGVGWQVVPAIRLEAKTGYSIASDVEIIGLQSDDFDGYKAELSAKFNLLKF